MGDGLRARRVDVRPYYEENGITIYHGDCRDILPSLPIADLLLTDPPYGLNRSDPINKPRGTILWDSVPVDLALLRDCISRADHAIVWGGNYFALPPSRGWLVWYKRDSVPSAADCELAWTSLDMNAQLIDHTIAATNAERNGYPTQKPLRVMRWSLSFLPTARTILDPFMGSGTTLRAAKDLGLRAVGMDKNERACEIAANRLRQEVLDFDPQPSPELSLGTPTVENQDALSGLT